MSGKLRPKARFLLTVWGKKYVDNLTAVALPSFLAPGNLPALAEQTDLEIFVMTTAASIPEFYRHSALARLERLCPVRFVLIDDLVHITNYSIILTAAFARGVMAAGEEQTNTYFIFMNADFVLADGSLRSLAHRILSGEGCIVAPSLRAGEEPLLPQLIRAVDPGSGVLAIPPRELVQKAFAHLHPTVAGKVVNQSSVHCEHCNQLYWKVDDTTLLGRFYLMFMLCIRPEKPLERVSFPCDYGFVPELAPSAAVTALTDSDDFFMLELQKVGSESWFLRSGPLPLQLAARSLAEWATAEHRRYAHFNLVFHSRDVPSGLAHVKAEADEMITRLEAMLPRPAVDHMNHWHWVSAINDMLEYEDRLGREIVWPREIDAHLFRRSHSPGGPKPSSRSAIPTMGRPPWYPDAADARMLRDVLQEVVNESVGPILGICRARSPIAKALADDPRFQVVELHALAAGFVPPEVASQRYRRILCCAACGLAPRVPAAVATAIPSLAEDGTVTVLLDDDFSGPNSNELSHHVVSVSLQLTCMAGKEFDIEGRFVGCASRRRLRRLERKFARWAQRRTGFRRLRVPLAWLGLAYVRVAAMIVDRKRPLPERAAPPSNCSSAVLVLRRRDFSTRVVVDDIMPESVDLRAAQVEAIDNKLASRRA